MNVYEAYPFLGKYIKRTFLPCFLIRFIKNLKYFNKIERIQSPYVLAKSPRLGTIGNHQIQNSCFGCSFFLYESDAFLINCSKPVTKILLEKYRFVWYNFFTKGGTKLYPLQNGLTKITAHFDRGAVIFCRYDDISRK